MWTRNHLIKRNYLTAHIRCVVSFSQLKFQTYRLSSNVGLIVNHNLYLFQSWLIARLRFYKVIKDTFISECGPEEASPNRLLSNCTYRRRTDLGNSRCNKVLLKTIGEPPSLYFSSSYYWTMNCMMWYTLVGSSLEEGKQLWTTFIYFVPNSHFQNKQKKVVLSPVLGSAATKTDVVLFSSLSVQFCRLKYTFKLNLPRSKIIQIINHYIQEETQGQLLH